jgi:di/tricarboxylate transporter
MADGISGGPLAIFDSEGNTIIIAPFSQFMASSLGFADFDNGVGWGFMGGIKMVPAGSQYDTLVYYAKGINKVYTTIIS